MTPEERAEKISEGTCEDPNCLERGHHRGCDLTNHIAAEIRAAVEEAMGNIGGHSLRSDVWEAAKAEAYEDAAKIAEAYAGPQSNDANQIAEDIRARAAEVGKC